MTEVDGVVASVSQSGSGIQINGVWYNYSSRTPVTTKPIRGQHVKLTHDESRWIQGLEILDGGAVQQRPGGGGPPRPRMTESERREVRRMNVLRTAADFAGRLSMSKEGISSKDVIVIAEHWLEWLERE